MRTPFFRKSIICSLLFFTLFSFGACKKNHDSPYETAAGYYIKFNANGKKVEYTPVTKSYLADEPSDDSVYQSYFTAGKVPTSGGLTGFYILIENRRSA